MKENIRSVANTEYVRLIKHKSKVLYDFTTKPNEFTSTEKNLVKDLYKRLRNLLKEVEKVKEVSVQTKKSSSDQEGVESTNVTAGARIVSGTQTRRDNLRSSRRG